MERINLLYKNFIASENPRDKNVLLECLQYSKNCNKELYELNRDEIIMMLNSYTESKRKRTRCICRKYIDYAYNNGYTNKCINVFELI